MKNGTTNGMMKMIVDKRVHVAVDAFGMSTARANVVDFTVPLLSASAFYEVQYANVKHCLRNTTRTLEVTEKLPPSNQNCGKRTGYQSN